MGIYKLKKFNIIMRILVLFSFIFLLACTQNSQSSKSEIQGDSATSKIVKKGDSFYSMIRKDLELSKKQVDQIRKTKSNFTKEKKSLQVAGKWKGDNNVSNRQNANQKKVKALRNVLKGKYKRYLELESKWSKR